ncbi:MAG: class I SAM-dependent methyltransferase [Candidatus Bathyarchaeota archaeon]|nr:class I SAM-dependent methyltransferase [Candidatus Bathyarchaeota archaeon]
MVSSKLGMKKYDMLRFWNKRAKEGSNIYEKVCVYGAPPQFNEIMDKIQKCCLNKLLKQIPDIHCEKILEVGCGVGRWAPLMLSKGAKYFGVDISSEMIRIAKRKVPEGDFSITNGQKLDFPEGLFDLVFSVTVLHHIPYNKQEKMVQEMRRVTKKNGYMIIVEDICLASSHFARLKNFDTKRAFNTFPLFLSEWVAIFAKYDCKCVKIAKHKFLQGYLHFLTRKSSRLTNNSIFKVAWIKVVEKIAASILPWNFFYGSACVFVREH